MHVVAVCGHGDLAADRACEQVADWRCVGVHHPDDVGVCRVLGGDPHLPLAVWSSDRPGCGDQFTGDGVALPGHRRGDGGVAQGDRVGFEIGSQLVESGAGVGDRGGVVQAGDLLDVGEPGHGGRGVTGIGEGVGVGQPQCAGDRGEFGLQPAGLVHRVRFGQVGGHVTPPAAPAAGMGAGAGDGGYRPCRFARAAGEIVVGNGPSTRTAS